MKKGQIIILNGVSSAGKTSIAKGFVKRLPEYFHLSVDDFDLLIEAMEDREKEKLIPVGTDDFFNHTIAMFSDHGVNLIVDRVIDDVSVLKECLKTLKDYPVIFVGVHCAPDELTRREHERGDRTAGQAIRQRAFVHHHEVYDITVDTTNRTTDECVEEILTQIQSKDSFNGFYETYRKVIVDDSSRRESMDD